jgi:hypothetical protein
MLVSHTEAARLEGASGTLQVPASCSAMPDAKVQVESSIL